MLGAGDDFAEAEACLFLIQSHDRNPHIYKFVNVALGCLDRAVDQKRHPYCKQDNSRIYTEP